MSTSIIPINVKPEPIIEYPAITLRSFKTERMLGILEMSNMMLARTIISGSILITVNIYCKLIFKPIG